MNKNMKAICTYNDGNNFDPKVGEIVEVKNLYITRVWRGEEELSIEDSQQGYFKSQEMIIAMLQENDEVENNYCHGQYKVINNK